MAGIPKPPLHDNLIAGKIQPHEGLTGPLPGKASPSFRNHCLSDSATVPARWCGGQGLGPDPTLKVGIGGRALFPALLAVGRPGLWELAHPVEGCNVGSVALALLQYLST